MVSDVLIGAAAIATKVSYTFSAGVTCCNLCRELI
jgi:hypothetical protein